MGTKDLAITYFSLAFAIRRRARIDRRLSKPAPSAWESNFWRLLEVESAATSPSVLRLR